MSVVSSNTVMSEGNLRVAGGWVLLPLVGEPVEVLVPCGGSDLKFVKIFKIFKIFKILKTLKVFKTEDLKTLNLRIQYSEYSWYLLYQFQNLEVTLLGGHFPGCF